MFWNPDCGFCQRILPELREWEAFKPKGSAEILLLSSGTEEANRAMGLQSRVLIDQEFALAPKLKAGGTPSAVVLGPERKIASEVAVGSAAVFAVAGRTQVAANKAGSGQKA